MLALDLSLISPSPHKFVLEYIHKIYMCLGIHVSTIKWNVFTWGQFKDYRHWSLSIKWICVNYIHFLWWLGSKLNFVPQWLSITASNRKKGLRQNLKTYMDISSRAKGFIYWIKSQSVYISITSYHRWHTHTNPSKCFYSPGNPAESQHTESWFCSLHYLFRAK